MKNFNILLNVIIFMYGLTLSVEAQFNYKYSEETLGIKDISGYNDCVKKYRDEIKKDSSAHINFYNLACCLSNLEKYDEAIQNLKTAVSKGFKDYLELQSNNDFLNLRDKVEWSEISILCKQNEISDYKSKGGNVELLELYFEDQMDRLGPNIGFEIIVRDSIRQKKTKKLMETNQLLIADDYFKSALIFQHGIDSNGYKTAHDLASKAMQMDSSNKSIRWLFAATKDRHLMSLHKPQVYGTQFKDDGYGITVLGDFDTLAIKDDERIWMTRRSLKQLLIFIEDFNRDFKLKINQGQHVLYSLYKTDQDSRRHLFNIKVFMYDPIEFVDENDKTRLEKVKGLIKKDSIKTAEDYYFSSMILYHSGGNIDSNNYKLAEIFAKKSLDLGLYFYFEYTAKWLVAASKDRYLLSHGKPQWFGTQYIQNSDGSMDFYKIDEKAITDDERMFWAIPPLDYLKKMIADYNLKNSKSKR